MASWRDGWPVGWLVDRLAAWSVSWPVVWRGGWLAGWLTGWLVGWLAVAWDASAERTPCALAMRGVMQIHLVRISPAARIV